MKIPEKAFYVYKLSLEGKTASEIADELGLTRKTVVYYLYLARDAEKNLKEEIRDLMRSFKSVEEFVAWVNSDDTEKVEVGDNNGGQEKAV